MLLERLLTAWRLTGDPALAAAIARVGRVLARERGPVDDRTFRGVALAHNAVDVDRLLDAPWPRSSTPALERLVLLAAFQPDPRIIQRLTAIRALYRGNRPAEQFHSLVNTIIERGPKPGTMGASYRPLLVEADGVADANDAVMAHVRAEPGDHALRAVVGDALQAVGDPRGELIALQLGPRTPESRTKIERLIQSHASEWIGPIPHRRRKFVAGFLASIEITAEDLSKSFDAPGWLTVEDVVFERAVRPGVFRALLERMPALRRVAVPAADMLVGAELPDRVACAQVWDPPPNVRVAVMPWTGRIPAMKALDAIGFTLARVNDVDQILGSSERWPPELRMQYRVARVRVRRGDSSVEIAGREIARSSAGELRGRLVMHGYTVRHVQPFELWD